MVGVDKMLYMKSTNANDGTYNLTVSFALGTDPDINTVNVNNRVQTALAELPAAVQAQGLTVQKASSAILEFVNFYSSSGEQDHAVHHQLRHHQRARRDFAHQRRGSGVPVQPAEIFDAHLVRQPAADEPQSLTPADVINAIQSQNVVAPVGRIGARPATNDVQFQFNVQTQGRLTTPKQFGDIVMRAELRWLAAAGASDVARVELGAQNVDSESAAGRQAVVAMRMSLAPGANAVATAKLVNEQAGRAEEAVSPGWTYQVTWNSTLFVTDTIAEVLKTLGEAFVLVVIVVFLFLGNLRATIIPTHCGAGQPDRRRSPCCWRSAFPPIR